MLAIILAFATVFSAAVPAMAETTSDNIPASSSASVIDTDSTQAVKSITIPLTFDGSNPDSSQVVVEKAQDTSKSNMKLFSTAFNSVTPPSSPSTPGGPSGSGTGTIDDGLPKKVVTDVSTTGSAIKIVTADRYFLYTPEDGTQQYPFAVEFEGLPTGDYFVTLESDSTTASSITCNIDKYGNKYLFSEDIKSIIGNVTTSAAIDLSVWQKGYNDTKIKLYGPVAVTVNYVENNLTTPNVSSYYKYVRSDSNSFDIELGIPGKAFANYYPIVYLVDSSGILVAKEYRGYQIYI